jgi:outer membrane protein
MKNLPYILNGVLAIAIGVLFFLHFKDCKSPSKSTTGSASSSTSISGSGTMAYVDLDTLETYYGYYKDKKAELEKSQANIESSLQSKADALQRDAYAFQQRAATMTQSEGEAAQASLQQRQADLIKLRDDRSAQLQGDQMRLLDDVNSKMDSVLQDFNKDKKYSFILSYRKGGPILYKDNALDISKPVIEALNAKQPAPAKK